MTDVPKAAAGQIEQLQSALLQIAEHGEELARMGEPQNYVPEYCRAVLAGYQGTLCAFSLHGGPRDDR